MPTKIVDLRKFRLTIIDGPKREMPAAGSLQTVKQAGLMLVPLARFCSPSTEKSRIAAKTGKAGLKRLLSVTILVSVISCQLPFVCAAATKPLMTDSTLGFSTYVGGSGIEEGNNIAVDSAGNIYFTGFTDSADFPSVNAMQPNFGGGQQDVLPLLGRDFTPEEGKYNAPSTVMLNYELWQQMYGGQQRLSARRCGWIARALASSECWRSVSTSSARMVNDDSVR